MDIVGGFVFVFGGGILVFIVLLLLVDGLEWFIRRIFK